MRRESLEYTIEEKVKDNEKILWALRKKWTDNLQQNLTNYLHSTRRIAPKHRDFAKQLHEILIQNGEENDIQNKAKALIIKIQQSISPRGWNLKISYLYRLCQFADDQYKILKAHEDKLVAAEDRYRLRYEKPNIELNKKVEDLSSTARTKETLISKITTDKNQLELTLGQNLQIIRNLSQQVQDLKDQLNSEQQSLNQSVADCQQRGEEILTLTKAKLALEEECNNLRSEITQLNKTKKPQATPVITHTQKNQKVKELKNELAEKDQRLKLYDNTNIEEVTQENAQLKETVAKLSQNTEQQRIIIQNQAKKIEEYETKISAQTESILTLSKTVEEQKSILIKLKMWIHKVFGQFGHSTKEETFDLIKNDKYTFLDSQIKAIKKIAIASRVELDDKKMESYINDTVFDIQIETLDNAPTLENKANQLVNSVENAVTSKLKSFFRK